MLSRYSWMSLATLLVACQEPSLKGIARPWPPQTLDCVAADGSLGDRFRYTCPTQYYTRDVDLLFVIDDSARMGPVQARLAEAMDTLVAELDALDVRPDLRVGFASVRQGDRSCGIAPRGLLPISSCRERPEAFIARDGTDTYDTSCTQVCPLETLAVESTVSAADDTPKPRRWIDFGPSGTNLSAGVAPSQALRCTIPRGTDGCGYPAMLQSLEDVFIDSFSEDFSGAGFFREPAGFVGVLVTNGVDCSVTGGGQTIFDPEGPRALWSDPTATAPTPAVCWNAGVACTPQSGPEYDACEPMARDPEGHEVESGLGVMTALAWFVDVLMYFGSNGRELFVLGGVPPQEGAEPVYVDADDPLFQAEYGIGPGCESPTGFGLPPVRLRALTERLRDGGMLSVCADDFRPAARRLAEAIAAQTHAGCVQGCVLDVEPDTEGLQVSCLVVRQYSVDDEGVEDVILRCDGEPGRPVLPKDEELCWFPRTDDALARECSEQGQNLAVELWWEGPHRPPVGRLSVGCNLSKHPTVDCPDL